MSDKKGLNSKKKGSRIELEFAKILTKRFDKEFKRTPQSGAWATVNKDSQIREDAKEILSGDIICPPNFVFSIECKGRAEFNFWNFLNEETNHLEIDDWIWQAEQDASVSKKMPLLLIKINRRKPFSLFPRSFYESNLLYGKFSILRLDYLLALDDKMFFGD